MQMVSVLVIRRTARVKIAQSIRRFHRAERIYNTSYMLHKIYFVLILLAFALPTSAQQVYEFRTYELTFFRSAEVLNQYLEQALIPALNRQGIENIGAFEESGEALPRKIYLLITYPDLQAYGVSLDALAADSGYQQAASSYLTADPQTMPFKRISVSLIRATTGFPELVKPREDAELFELRIYESYNEDALRRKVKMFNDSEFDIFKEVGLPTVFFGTNIAGDQMPCLTYMLAFKDMEAQVEAWSKFGPNPEWQRITKLKEYEGAMNEITRIFLRPLPYSQI